MNYRGQVNFTPTADFNGNNVDFGFTVSDGIETVTGHADITVTPVNDAPDLGNGSGVDQTVTLVVPEDSNARPLGFNVPTDPDGDALTITVTQIPTAAQGVVTVGAGGPALVVGSSLTPAAVAQLFFKPTADFNGNNVDFEFTVSDGTDSITGHADITVTPVNDAPDVGNGSGVNETVVLVVAEDSTPRNLGFSVPTDPDGDALLITVTQVPTAGQGVIRIGNNGAVINTGDTLTPAQVALLTFQPTANFNGNNVDFEFTAFDGTATVTGHADITVTPVNDAPNANDDGAVMNKNTSINVNVLGNDSDPDGDSLSVTNITGVQHGSATINPNGTISYTPNAGFSGSETITYTISDGNGGTDTAVLQISVIDNDILLVNPATTPAGYATTAGGEDVLIGDGTGTETANVAAQKHTYNVVITLDVSGSMTEIAPGSGGKTKMQLAQESALEIVNQYQAFGTSVTFTLVTFGVNAQTFQYATNNYNSIKTQINNVGAPTGNTHYDVAINTLKSVLATDVASAPSSALHHNVVYFLSDSTPTAGHHVSYSQEWDNFMNNNMIESNAFIVGSGIYNIDTQPIDNTNRAQNITNANQITVELETFTGGTLYNPYTPNADRFDGSDGDDIIFGDTINVDWIPGVPDGSGWQGLEDYLINNAALNPTGVTPTSNWDAFEAIALQFIRDNMVEGKFLDENEQFGGNDNLYGWNGNDIILGGGGKDYISGEGGVDRLYGGTDNDTITWDHTDAIIDGGLGEDMLYMRNASSNSVNLNDTRITQIESVYAKNSHADSITVKSADVIRLADDNLFVIRGDANIDTVTGSNFTRGANVNIEGTMFAQFTGTGANSDAILRVELGVVYNGVELT